MPTFHNPRMVVVTEGGSWLAPVLAVGGLAVIVSAAAVIEDILTAILITVAVLAVGGTAGLVVLVRRSGGLWIDAGRARAGLAPVPPPAAVTATVTSARRLAIEPPRTVYDPAPSAVSKERSS